MTTYDPRCPAPDPHPTGECRWCALIAEVRANERERILKESATNAPRAPFYEESATHLAEELI